VARRDFAGEAALVLATLAVAAVAALWVGAADAGKGKMRKRTLTPEEERVIVHKGTERPFTGEYWNTRADGTYTCRRCGAPLFRAEDKFDAGCGWPSFDDALPGAVRETPDADGARTEITCARCGGHLGHVFRGEGFTPKETRHCVNSVSLDLQPARGRALFAGGCFWGVEAAFERHPGVLDVRSGYTGGFVEAPSYEEVCAGATGHAEAVEVTFDPAKTTYEALARLFFEIHDPTQIDAQGPDVGPQYRSAIFYLDDEQKRIADKLVAALERKGYDVATEIAPAGRFHPAEAYHQDWYRRHGGGSVCHRRVERF
jgi:peptide methionine sulfoxide reductase msrA/msrB